MITQEDSRSRMTREQKDERFFDAIDITNAEFDIFDGKIASLEQRLKKLETPTMMETTMSLNTALKTELVAIDAQRERLEQRRAAIMVLIDNTPEEASEAPPEPEGATTEWVSRSRYTAAQARVEKTRIDAAVQAGELTKAVASKYKAHVTRRMMKVS